MKFYYSTRFVQRQFLLAFFQLAIGVISIITDSINTFFQYGWLVLGVLTLLDSFFKWKKYFIKIEDNNLIIKRIIKKQKIKLTDYYNLILKNNEIILLSGSKEKKINYWGMDSKTVERLLNEIEQIIK